MELTGEEPRANERGAPPSTKVALPTVLTAIVASFVFGIVSVEASAAIAV